MKRILRTSFALALVALMAVPVMAGGVEIGQMAPDFTLTDQDGNEHKLSEYQGKVVVLEWTNPQCPFVVHHYKAETMTKLAAKYGEQDVVWFAVNSSHFTNAEETMAWAKKNSVGYPTLQDASGEVGMTYGAKTTPHMFVIDTKGKIVYQGAIDDDSKIKGEPTQNYVDAAVASTLKGEPVKQAMTKPYGCSVKYGEGAKKQMKSAAASR